MEDNAERKLQADVPLGVGDDRHVVVVLRRRADDAFEYLRVLQDRDELTAP